MTLFRKEALEHKRRKQRGGATGKHNEAQEFAGEPAH